MIHAFAPDSIQVHQIQRGGLPTLTQLLSADAPRFALSLIAVGGVVWLITYLAALRTSHRERVTTIPLAAVCLNITWEVVHSIVYPPPRQVDLYTNLAWLGLDLLILLQIFRYGRARQSVAQIRDYFAPVVIGVLVLSFVGHLTFHRHVTANSIFPDESGAIPAYLINLVMSVLFVSMYYQRTDGAGLSKTVAWGKCVGSLCYAVGNILVLNRLPTVTYEVQVRAAGAVTWVPAGEVGNTTIHPGFIFFLFAGIAIFDIIYLYLLYFGPRGSHRAPAPQ
ncbi:MAG: hypothetical protein SFV24_10710 [Gemmatimonadales bacterium]|nr:hypothetical protein [Gemmatimonadales bacterium]